MEPTAHRLRGRRGSSLPLGRQRQNRTSEDRKWQFALSQWWRAIGRKCARSTKRDWPPASAVSKQKFRHGINGTPLALPHSRLVARDAGVVGWAALSPFSTRSCYGGVADRLRVSCARV